MKKTYISATVLVLFFAAAGLSQTTTAPKPAGTENASMDMAKATVAAHGGDKLKQMKTLVMKGSVDLNINGQTVPAAFSSVFSGEKYYFEIMSPVQQLKQAFDGRSTYSSLQGFALPPMTSLGFPLLPKVGEPGYTVSAIGDKEKKKKGFRITTPEGFYTDFYTNEKTNQIKGYDSSFETGGGQIITTSVEIDEFQTVDGLLVPKKYSQRFDLGPITAYANFKTKEILVNSPISDSVFAMPK
jgi:hypothetical protein